MDFGPRKTVEHELLIDIDQLERFIDQRDDFVVAQQLTGQHALTTFAGNEDAKEFARRNPGVAVFVGEQTTLQAFTGAGHPR